MSHIVIIDDDRDFARTLQIQLEIAGHTVRSAATGKAGIEACREREPDVVLLDLKLRETDGLDVMRRLRDAGLAVPVIMITGEQDARANISAVKEGVVDYLRKPFSVDVLLDVIQTAVGATAAPAPASVVPIEAISENPYEIVGQDPGIAELLKQIGMLARSRVNVLIRGESGTGKEVVGRALHEATSPEQPFVAVNCTAVVPTLLESELFGHEKGAFTGADKQKAGMCELAGEGTLFLDEIGDLPLELQPKLLRVIQEREFCRVGGTRPIPFSARLIAVTHRNLEQMVESGEFREDLYYRLAVTTLTVPPLRDRRGDIGLIARHLLWRISRELHRPLKGITREALEALEQYGWPGNIREMANVLTRAVALSDHDVLTAETLKLRQQPYAGEEFGRFNKILPLADVEKQYIQIALKLADWNITRVAEGLGITRTTLRKKIADYGIERE